MSSKKTLRTSLWASAPKASLNVSNVGQPSGNSEIAATFQPQSLRIVLIANVRLYREGLAAQLGARPGFSIVRLAADFDEATDAVRSTRPDVVLLDMGMPGISDLVRVVKSVHADARIVAFAVDECERDIEACAEAGVTGFVTRDVTVDGLAAAITAAVQGDLACSPRAAALLFRRLTALSTVSLEMRSQRSLLATLTVREREIASLIVGGRSNKEISRGLNIAVPTVKNHIHHILDKLQVKSRAEAAARVRVFSERGN